MQRLLGSILLLTGCLAGVAVHAQPDASPTLAIVGGQLIDGHGGEPVWDAVVLVAGNRIVEVGREGSVAIPAGVRTIDANGMTVMPGLWESHGHLIHVGSGDPANFPSIFEDQAGEIMADVARITLMGGVTSFRDTGGPIEPQLALRADIEAGRLPGPRLFLAGPILFQRQTPQQRNNQYRIIIEPNVRAAREEVTRVIGLGVNQIKVYAFWDLEILKAVVDTAHAAGLGVDADVRHIEAYRTAVEAGVDRLHHVFAADALVDYSDEDLRLLIRGNKPSATGPMANILRGPYIIPTVEMRVAYARAIEFPELLDHPRIRDQFSPEVYEHLRSTWTNPAAIPWGIGAPERIKVMHAKLSAFIAAGGREQIVAGTDAGAPLNLHPPVLRELAHYGPAGLTPMEVIQSATLRPAQMQGVSDELGTVSPGKLADIIIVDGDPLQDITVLQHRVALIIKDGEVHQPAARPTF